MVGVREPPQMQQKENVAEFVARKREIFLVQMSLDTKRAEIRALQVSGACARCQDVSETCTLALARCTQAIWCTHFVFRRFPISSLPSNYC